MELLTKPFSKDWWNDFKKNTGNLSFPTIRKDIFNDNVQDLRDSIFEMFQNLKYEKELLAWRVWCDGKLNTSLEKKIIDDPIQGEDDFLPWCQRIFGDKTFGVILNDGQRYSKKTRDMVLGYFAPLLETNPPLGGINFSIFVGNYGWTPIGIHQDHTGSFVMHFHLGPGKKEMHMWQEKNYKELLYGRENEMNPEAYIPFSDFNYTFEDGDIFFMPWDYYHIGRSEEISIGLTVWFNYTTVDGLLNGIYSNGVKEIIDDFKEEYANSNQIIYPNNLTADRGPFNEILNQIDEEVLKGTLVDFIENQLDDYTHSLISNNWYDRGAIKNKFNLTNDIDLQSTVALIIAPISFKKRNDILKIFHRGDKIDLMYHDDLVELINRINQRKSDTVAALIEGLFQEWPEGIGRRIIEIFVENCIVEII
jgi:hypothetical protein